MRTKCGQVVLDGLLVSDVEKELSEHRDLGFLRGRNRNAATDHHREETDRSKRDGLASGIRAGDQHGLPARFHFEVEWHDIAGVLACGCGEVDRKRWVQAATNHEARPRVEHRNDPVIIIGNPCLGLDHVECRQR